MKRRSLILILIIIAAAVGVLFVLLWRSNGQRYDWRPNYRGNSLEPYGAQVLKHLLDEHARTTELSTIRDTLRSQLKPDSTLHANYVFIGESMYIDSADVQAMLAFVETGNRAFILSRSLPFDLMFYLYYEECNGYAWDGMQYVQDTLIQVRFDAAHLPQDQWGPYRFWQRDQVEFTSWPYFDDAVFCGLPNGLEPIGSFNDYYVNYVRIPYGAGYFFLHSNPLLFTNFHLRDEKKLAYAEQVFEPLLAGPVYWDEYSKVAEWMNPDQSRRQRDLSRPSPLSFILRQPALAWAWYLLLGAAVLFIAFRAKRRQRVIPVLEGNRNTSLEFLSSIGQLYFQHNDHRKLAVQQSQLFHHFLRERYQLNRQEEQQPGFLDRLAAKSDLPAGFLQQLLNMDGNIQRATFVSGNTLIEWHQKLDYFYKNCK